MPEQRVVLVRHGETEWSQIGRHTGRSDIPLTDRGRAQAVALGTELGEWQFRLVLTSPLRRAEETCRLAGYRAQAQLRPDLVEWDYGDYEGLTSAQIKASQPHWSLWGDGAPGGESPAAVGVRVDRILGEVRKASGDVLLFAHGHVLRVLAARWLDQPPAAGRYYALKTAGLSVLGYEHDAPVIDRWNEGRQVGAGQI